MSSFDKAGGSKARNEARQGQAARAAGAAAVLNLARAARRASEQNQQSVYQEASQHQPSTSTAASSTSRANPAKSPPGKAEARMLQDMFKAVFPDLRGISGATRAVAYSGSLTMSLAFAGVVYWAATSYNKAPPPASKTETELKPA